MLPKLKVWEVDYSFIISNYLNPELWKKSWNLFEYKNYVFSLTLSSIDTENMAIKFRIKCNKIWSSTSFEYYLNNMDIEFLKKQINLKIYDLINATEEQEIRISDGYRRISEGSSREKELLTEIAESFLDSNNVANEDIRDVYIDYYVSENQTVGGQLSDYVKESKYKYLTELWLIFANSTKDNDKIKIIENSIDEDEREEILKEVEKYMEYLETDEAVSDFEDKLESI